MFCLSRHMFGLHGVAITDDYGKIQNPNSRFLSLLTSLPSPAHRRDSERHQYYEYESPVPLCLNQRIPPIPNDSRAQEFFSYYR